MLKKLSKSDQGPKWCYKAQVFKANGYWVYACQEGHGGRYVPGASWEVMYRFARDHMLTYHSEEGTQYRSQLITDPSA